MHYLRAAVALVAAMTFSMTALGERRTAIAVFTGPSGGVAPPDGAPPCVSTFCTSIPTRYKNTFIIGITEYETTYPCFYIDHGQWTPGTNIQPIDKGTPAGTVDVSELAIVGPTPPGCTAAGGPYLYAPLYFDWTLHKNLTWYLGYGPTAFFQSNWYTKDGWNLPYSFQITVPVVRPIGETISFKGFTGVIGNGLVGQWLQTLTPPTDDPSFDFTGETVQEDLSASIGNCLSPPAKLVPLAGTTRPPSTFPVENGPPGQWVDGVGFGDEADSACAVLYNFCYQPSGCLMTRTQTTAIKSDADFADAFTKYGGVNRLTAGLLGRILPVALPFQSPQGFGRIFSSRQSTESLSSQSVKSNLTLISTSVCKNLVLTNCK